MAKHLTKEQKFEIVRQYNNYLEEGSPPADIKRHLSDEYGKTVRTIETVIKDKRFCPEKANANSQVDTPQTGTRPEIQDTPKSKTNFWTGNPYTRKYFDYAISQEEQTALENAEKGRATTEDQKKIKRVKRRASLQGYSPEHDMTKPAPATHYVKGTSTLYDEKGKKRLQWVKTDKKFNDQKQVARELIDALKEDLPVLDKSIKPNHQFSSDKLAVYPMGDPHFGMFSWAEETGTDFDLKIAERDLCNAVDRLVDTVPPCKEALIVNLGDFFHADNSDGRTARSGHSLDTDTRWAKVLRVGISAIRQCISSALLRHEKVSVINAIGNHDDHTAMFLSVALANIYEKEPRINIIDNPTIKHYYRFGNTLIGVHHGHTIKMDKLPMQMATDRPHDWAETKYKYWLTGHIHHDSKKEFETVIVESFRTLAGTDAWHSSMGYKSGRDMKAIVIDKNFGQIERHIVSVDMLRNDKPLKKGA